MNCLVTKRTPLPGQRRSGLVGLSKFIRFEQVYRDIIFLDEIGSASPAVQLRLLRVLQEREFERVGSTQCVNVDVRLIAGAKCRLTGVNA